MESLLVKLTNYTFDLSKGPLVKFDLIKLSDDEHYFVLTIHHIISDGWSMGIFLDEFALLYRSFITGIEPSLETLRVQYSDYAAWQRRLLENGSLDHQKDYWKHNE